MAYDAVPVEPERATGVALFRVIGSITYPTGTVDWGPVLAPGPDGLFDYIIPACIPAGAG